MGEVDNLDALSELLAMELEKEEDVSEERNDAILSRDTLAVADGESRDGEATEDLSTMKAKMAEMERQLKELKELMSSTTSQKLPAAVKREDTTQIKSGPRKRTAHQSRGVTTQAETTKRRNVGVASPDESCDTEHYTGLRIKNPLVSSELMKQRMSGRKLIRIPNLHRHMKNGEIAGDWVTAGVLVHKLPPKDTARGSKFTVWKLSDLSSQLAVVSLFLFDKVFENHWKTPVGHVVAILNPKIQTDRETDNSTGTRGCKGFSLSLDHPGKLMLMGVSYDFTCCLATTKSGKQCQNFASKQHGGRCEYHVQDEYSKLRSKRMDCQGGFGPKGIDIQAKVLGNTEVFHQGKWFTGEKMRAKRDREDGSNGRLFAPGAKEKSSELEDILGKELLAGSGVKKFKDGVRTHSGGEIFKKLLQGQTPGALCYQKYKKKEEIKSSQSTTSNGKSALQLLQEHSSKTSVNKKLSAEKPALSSFDELELFTPDFIPNKENVKLSPPTTSLNDRPTISPAVALSKPKVNHTPSLKSSSLLKEKEKAAKQRAKEIAIATISGSKISPAGSNSRRGRELTERQLEADTDRVDRNVKREERAVAKDDSSQSSLDLKKLETVMAAKSSHQQAVQQDELAAEEAYFSHLEKKEAIEERLQDIKELNVRVVQCQECKYIAESAGERCRKENHSLSRLRALKRCFQCCGCGFRHFTYNERYPKRPCSCGENNYKATSLYNVRKGPKLPSEELSLRGDEQKFLNSLN